MVWSLTDPAGSEAISNGDNRIRELKTDVQSAFRSATTDGLIGSFPGTDTANPVFAYRGAIGTTAQRPAASANVGLYHNTTLNTIQRCTGAAYADVATLIPSGSALPWYQATVPVGWTAVAGNDKAMRIVTTGTTGGSQGGTNAFSTLGTGLSTANESAHTHTATTGDATINGGTGQLYDAGGFGHVHTLTTSAGSAHGHTIGSLAPQYADFVIGSKD